MIWHIGPARHPLIPLEREYQYAVEHSKLADDIVIDRGAVLEGPLWYKNVFWGRPELARAGWRERVHIKLYSLLGWWVARRRRGR